MIFPWQALEWRMLWQRKQDGRLPHALLLTGIVGLGKTIFAEHFARALLCHHVQFDGAHCELQALSLCHPCRLIAAKTHPNLCWITPEKAEGVIKIDQIRDVIDFVNQTAFQGKYRIVVIDQAHCMNKNAANALLKTLEEPTPATIIFLISNQSEQLPATIRSRCQSIMFHCPDKKTGLAWLNQQLVATDVDGDLLLNLTQGAPLAALNLSKSDTLATRQALLQKLYSLSLGELDPIQIAATIGDNISVVQIIDIFISWVIDLLRLQWTNDLQGIINKDFKDQLLRLKDEIPIKHNTNFMECLLKERRELCQGFNLNKQLIIESIFIKWMSV